MLSLRGCLGRGALVVAGFVLSTAGPASAGQLYRWTTSDGTVAYSDDAKRVPVAYRARAARTTIRSLEGYDRFTPADADAQDRHAERLAARLERLRELNAPATPLAPVAAPGHPVGALDLRSARRVSERRLVGFDRQGHRVYRRSDRMRSLEEPVPHVGLAVDPDDPAPVIIERRRVLDEDTGVTRHVTVVEQGGRVLGIVKPRVHAGPVYSSSEEEIER